MSRLSPNTYRSSQARTHVARTAAFAITCIAVALAYNITISQNPANAAPGSDLRSPQNSLLPEPPTVSAKAYIVYDANEIHTLASANPTEERAIASLTKLMTALIVVEHTDGTEKVTVTKRDLTDDGGSGLGVKPGDVFTVDELLNAMLVYSANDAAVVLARHVGNTQSGFIEQMNARARKLSMAHTHYSSVNGLDSVKGNVSTADDLMRLAETVMDDDRIKAAVKMPSITIRHKDGTTAKFVNRNPFLASYKGVDGVKTGTTNFAGHCLLVHYANKALDDNIFVLVLGEKTESQRDADTKALLDWARSLRPTIKVSEAGEIVGKVPVSYHRTPVTLFAEDDIEVPVRIGSTIKEKLNVPKLLEPPLAPGDEVGTITFYADGKKIGATRVYINAKLRKLDRIGLVKLYASEYRHAWNEGQKLMIRRGKDALGYFGFYYVD